MSLLTAKNQLLQGLILEKHSCKTNASSASQEVLRQILWQCQIQGKVDKKLKKSTNEMLWLHLRFNILQCAGKPQGIVYKNVC